jgi:hypothetical protein
MFEVLSGFKGGKDVQISVPVFRRFFTRNVLDNSGKDPVIVAAGDIVCSSMGKPTSKSCQHMAVANLMGNLNPDAVLTLGDNCHNPGDSCFSLAFGPSWGRFRPIIHPVTGNHEYYFPAATPYFDYFNGNGKTDGPAGDRHMGYYSFDLGSWHIIALNSQCRQIGGCGPNSPQYKWLENDLNNHPEKCTLAYYHIPLFSSGGRASLSVKPLFTLLYLHKADLVLNGHDHVYERFAPQDMDGRIDNQRGIREFISGTGGAYHTHFTSPAANSIVRNNNSFGVLMLTLHKDRYDWRFVPVVGDTFTDSGSSLCH